LGTNGPSSAPQAIFWFRDAQKRKIDNIRRSPESAHKPREASGQAGRRRARYPLPGHVDSVAVAPHLYVWSGGTRTPRWPRQVGGRYYDQRRMRYRLHGRRAAKASEVLAQRSDRVLLTMIAKAQRMLMSARPGGGSRALRSARTCTQSRGGSARTQRAGQLRNKIPAPQQFTTVEATGPPK